MNADILKRVVRAIADGSQSDLDRLASKIVEAERKTGHVRLAAQLEAILKQHKAKRYDTPSAAANVDRTLKELPLSRRHGENLATLIPHDQLEHHMVLPDAVEQRFARIEAEYAARDRLRVIGFKPRKTVLLYGPPGCGKSLGAKRPAWNTGLPLMKVRFDVLISSFFGESAQNLRSIFSAAREKSCVLLLDECDFIARSRTASKDIGEVSRIVNSLLQLMEEYDAPGLRVATTNLESALDPALFRRFDDVFSIPLPGPEEIEKLLRMTLSTVRFEQPMHWGQLASKLSGSSAAMVVKAAQDAAKAAVLAGGQTLVHGMLAQTIEELQRHDAAHMGQGMPGQHNVEHLPLLLRYQGRARLPNGGKTNPQTLANKNARQAHSAMLQGAAQALAGNWKQRQAERQGQALPVIPNGIPIPS